MSKLSRDAPEGALSGSFVMRHCEILRSRLGVESFASVVGSLEPAAREAIVRACSDSWVPVTDMEALYFEVGRALGRDPPKRTSR